VPRCLTIEQRKNLLLGPRPPAWCVGMGKYPYDTMYWKAFQAGNLKDAVDSSTADAYGNFADKALKEGDYRIALEAAELGITFDPKKIWITGNKAHANMFLGKIEEAYKEYLAHRGEFLEEQQQPWETAVVDDFQKLRLSGREHPLMAEIEGEFKSALPVEANK
jgi:hypothetical protein